LSGSQKRLGHEILESGKNTLDGNRDANMVLRSKYAKVMIELMHQDKRIINVDETWLSQSDFRRRKWKL
jgi:hypothetical protein